jgi:hypothetical protein
LTLTTVGSVLTLPRRAAQATWMTQNYPGPIAQVRLFISLNKHLLISILARFLSNDPASNLIHGSHYQIPQPTPAHHRSSQQQSPPDSHSIRSSDSGSPYPPSKPHPLQLDTAALMNQVGRAASVSTYPDSSNTRHFSDSTCTMPAPFCRDRSTQDHSRSLSATPSTHVHLSLVDQTTSSPASASRLRPGVSHPQGNRQASSPTPYHRSPIMYPALLSRVAEALRARFVLTDIVKDGLTYKNAFNGHQAVNKIAYIIKTTDRNLALLLGRALDVQKYFPCRHL